MSYFPRYIRFLFVACLASAAALPVLGHGDNMAAAGPSDAPPGKEDLANSIGMKFKHIKPGKFLMGSPMDESGRGDNEGPQHKVELSRPFYLGVYPVTKGQFAAFVKDEGYLTEGEKKRESKTWRNPGFDKYDQSDDDPVVCVSGKDMAKFCEWLSMKEKKTYTLPTEAQWEYACRAGTTTIYSFGDDSKALDQHAWHRGNSDFHTHPVGAKKPNQWGLYDMHGNVWQRCGGAQSSYSYEISDQLYRSDLSDHMLRGGSWISDSWACRSACRFGFDPGFRSASVGFRVCLHVD